MTINKFLIFTIIFVWANSSGAVSPLCRNSGQLNSPCNVQTRSQSPLGNLSKLETQLWITSEVETIQDVYRHKKDLFANMFRLIENQKLDDKNLEPKTQKEIDGTIDDFQTLFHLSQTIKILSTKLQICYSGKCGPMRRIELEDQLSIVQKSKTFF